MQKQRQIAIENPIDTRNEEISTLFETFGLDTKYRP